MTEDSELKAEGATEEFIAATGSVGNRLLNAMGGIGYVQKDKRNDFHKYKYLSEAAVKKAVQAALVSAGEMPRSITFPMERWKFWEFHRKGKDYVRCMLVCVITFEDGRAFEGMGCGEDSEDKFVMKAQTSAIREAWKNTFCIPSGDDPEASNPGNDEGEPKQQAKGRPAAKPAGPSDEQLAALKKAREALGLSSKDAAAIVHHLFDARFMDLSGEQIDKLDELLVNMNKATAEAVKGGDLSGVKVPS